MSRRPASSKAARANAFVELQGTFRGPLPDSRAAGPVDGNEVISLTVRTKSKQPFEELRASVQAQYQTPLKDRHYLTHEELAERHGALAADLDDIEQFAHTRNLVVSRRSAIERSLKLTGRISDLRRAFPADLRLYHHASGPYRGRSGAVKIPRKFAEVITGVFGYDTRPRHRARNQPHAASDTGTGTGVPSTVYALRYNFPVSHQGTTLDGKGQCVAIVELGGGFRSSDLQVFFSAIGVPVPAVSAISVDQATNNPSIGGGADDEVMLDIQVAGAVVPKANFAIYFAPNQGSGLLDAVNAAVHDVERKPSVISISWGGPEDPGDKQATDAFSEIFTAAAALGITICTATGDHGVADQDGQWWDGAIHVDHPSADPMVLACGGTQIDQASGADVVWNDGTTFDPSLDGGGGWATGGGISAIAPRPDYQTGAYPGALDTQKPGRGIPDIAMCATNYRTRADGIDSTHRGTSAVAPLMAALVVRLNQASGKSVGFLNRLLYATPGLCKPVVTGNNGIAGKVAGYQAGPGWNACAGLGTPDGMAILNAL